MLNHRYPQPPADRAMVHSAAWSNVASPKVFWWSLATLAALSCVGIDGTSMPSLRTQATGTADRQSDSERARHVRTGDTIGVLLDHPAFAGLGRLILPWDDRDYDRTMPIEDIGRLLPYHSNVIPGTVVEALNRMIDDASRDQTVFYDIYTDVEKQSDPTRRNAGLFFFRGEAGAPFAVVAPGGGFSYVGSVHEGFPYAAEISRRGYNAFVLKYRVGQGGTTATQDLAVALSYIFRNANALGVSTRAYSLWGSSAGARMVATIGSHGTEPFGLHGVPKPSAVVMAYTGHSDVGSNEPATFAVVGADDGIAPPSAMERRVEVLRRGGTAVEYHRYPGVGHGFGLGIGTSAEGWIADALRFWTTQIHSDQERQPGLSTR